MACNSELNLEGMWAHGGVAQQQDEMLRRVDHKRGMRPLMAELQQTDLSGGRGERPQQQPARRSDNLPGRNVPPKNARYKNGIPMLISFDLRQSGRSVSPYGEKDDK
jgi:hypothetical protein